MKPLLKQTPSYPQSSFAQSRNNPKGFFFRSWNVDKTMSFNKYQNASFQAHYGIGIYCLFPFH